MGGKCTGVVCRRRRREETTDDGASRLLAVGETAGFVCATMSCVEGEGSGKMMKEKSSFAVTCGLLSRYLRDKRGGALQGLAGLDMATPAAAAGGEGGELACRALSAGFLVNLPVFSCCKLDC